MGCPKGQLFLFAHLSGKKQSIFALWNGGFSCLHVVSGRCVRACWRCLLGFSVLADVGWGTHSRYVEFSTPYGGFYPVTQDGLYQSQKRFGAYRFHIADPIRFAENLRVTIQALGWRDDGRYLPLQDDIASVAFWYQTLPTAPFPALPDREFLEII